MELERKEATETDSTPRLSGELQLPASDDISEKQGRVCEEELSRRNNSQQMTARRTEFLLQVSEQLPSDGCRPTAGGMTWRYNVFRSTYVQHTFRTISFNTVFPSRQASASAAPTAGCR